MAGLSEDDVPQLLLQIARFGQTISNTVSEATGSPDWSSNASIIVLCALAVHGPLRPGAIQDLTTLTSGGVSKMLDRMEASGLVKRSYGTVRGDSRGVLVRLTPRGQKTLGKISGRIAKQLPETKVFVKEMSTALDG